MLATFAFVAIHGVEQGNHQAQSIAFPFSCRGIAWVVFPAGSPTSALTFGWSKRGRCKIKEGRLGTGSEGICSRHFRMARHDFQTFV